MVDSILSAFRPMLDEYVVKFQREGTSIAILHAAVFAGLVYVIVDSKTRKLRN